MIWPRSTGRFCGICMVASCESDELRYSQSVQVSTPNDLGKQKILSQLTVEVFYVLVRQSGGQLPAIDLIVNLEAAIQ